jgi:hypothetical protein
MMLWRGNLEKAELDQWLRHLQAFDQRAEAARS